MLYVMLLLEPLSKSQKRSLDGCDRLIVFDRVIGDRSPPVRTTEADYAPSDAPRVSHNIFHAVDLVRDAALVKGCTRRHSTLGSFAVLGTIVAPADCVASLVTPGTSNEASRGRAVWRP